MTEQKEITLADEKPVKIEFTPTNTQVIRKLMGKYGTDEVDVVINALILLYTISEKCPSARYITAQGPSGVITIPLSMV
jgi:hypothetical protein